MKRIVLIAALATVTACSKPAPAPEATAEPAAEATVAAAEGTVAADGKPSVGKFQVTTSDGKTIVEEVKADGTYVDTENGKVVETGKWEQQSPAVWCFTKDGGDGKQICSDEKVENGVYTSTNRETKKTSTVVRLEG